MKPLLIIANFKSNKTKNEAENWLKTIEIVKNSTALEDKKIVVCPPFTLLDLFNKYISSYNLPFSLGAQNISRLPEGAYTGEVNGAQIKDFAEYVIVGHSERRSGFGEDESVVEEKVKMAIDYNLTPILCVQSAENKIPQNVSIVAYEPVFAIGTGNPDTPENANAVAKNLKEKGSIDYIIYGGSVTPENVKSFTTTKNINGVLVGIDSLDPEKFLRIIENA